MTKFEVYVNSPNFGIDIIEQAINASGLHHGYEMYAKGKAVIVDIPDAFADDFKDNFISYATAMTVKKLLDKC